MCPSYDAKTATPESCPVLRRSIVRKIAVTKCRFSIICAYASFIFADAIVPETLNSDACLSCALFSHWFILVTFAWVAIECCHLYRIASDVFTAKEYLSRSHSGDTRTYRLKVVLIAWGASLVFPVVCAVVSEMHFGDTPVYLHKEYWCWLNPQHLPIIFLCFAIPVTLIAVLNGGALCYFIHVKRKVGKRVFEEDDKVLQLARKANWKRMLSAVLLCVSLNVTWILGYLVLFACHDDTAKEVLAIGFILINASQGLFILVIHLRTLPEGCKTLLGDVFPRFRRRRMKSPKIEIMDSGIEVGKLWEGRVEWNAVARTIKMMLPGTMTLSSETGFSDSEC